MPLVEDKLRITKESIGPLGVFTARLSSFAASNDVKLRSPMDSLMSDFLRQITAAVTEGISEHRLGLLNAID